MHRVPAVQVGGLYYYVTDKAALLRLMANELCDQVLHEFDARPAAAFRSAPAPSRLDGAAPWAAAAVGLCSSVREVLNRHRDAARVLAVSPLNGSLSALALMDRLIALLEPGITAELANVAADTLMAYVTGFVLQEQSGVPRPFPMSPEELAARFPRVFRPVSSDDDHNFINAAATIISGFHDLAPQLAPQLASAQTIPYTTCGFPRRPGRSPGRDETGRAKSCCAVESRRGASGATGGRHS